VCFSIQGAIELERLQVYFYFTTEYAEKRRLWVVVIFTACKPLARNPDCFHFATKCYRISETLGMYLFYHSVHKELEGLGSV
jgi:hypothetical protein